MKVNKSFRLSEEAVEVLNAQENATQYLEDLIMQKDVRPAPWLNLEKRIDDMCELIKNNSLADAKIEVVEEPDWGA